MTGLLLRPAPAKRWGSRRAEPAFDDVSAHRSARSWGVARVSCATAGINARVR